MPPITVQLPNGATAQFPEGMNPADIQKAIEADPQFAPPPSTLQKVETGAEDLGVGALKGAGSTLSNIGKVIFPDWAARAVGMTPPTEAQRESYYAPKNGMQSLGKGIEQAGEFLVPGAAEEEGAAKLAKLAPELGKAAEPLAHVLTGALSSGAVNKAQGGSFGVGAAAGAAGQGIAHVLKSAAPAVAEFAHGISTPGSKTGKAILEETSPLAIFPGQVQKSAQGVLDELNPQLDEAAKRASVRPNVAKALLPAPATEIPMGIAPDAGEMPGGLLDAQRFPAKNIGEARVIRNKRGQILPRAARNVEFPESRPPARISPIRGENGTFVSSAGMTPEGPGERPLLPPGRDPNNGRMLPRTPTRQAWMTGATEEVPPVPPISGPGVLIRPFEGESGEIPTTIPSRSMSLTPARKVAQDYVNRASEQNLPKFIKGTKNLANQISVRNDTGEPIEEVVTPWEGLQLKRGVGNAVSPTKWKPGYKDPFTGAQKAVYGALNDSFESAVPEARQLNRRISRLIPASKPGKQSFSRYVSPALGTLMGGYTGAMRGLQSDHDGTPNLEKAFTGGLTGALLGGTTGYAAPGALTLAARLAHGPVLQRVAMPLAKGAALQLDRKKDNHADDR